MKPSIKNDSGLTLIEAVVVILVFSVFLCAGLMYANWRSEQNHRETLALKAKLLNTSYCIRCDEDGKEHFILYPDIAIKLNDQGFEQVYDKETKKFFPVSTCRMCDPSDERYEKVKERLMNMK